MPTPVDIWPPYTRSEAEELAYLTPSRREELTEEFGDPCDDRGGSQERVLEDLEKEV